MTFETAPTLVLVARARTKPTPAESLGARIRRFRRLKGLTQIELARQVGLSPRMMAYYEIQDGTPSWELLVKLADALGVTMDALAGRQDGSRKSAARSLDPRLLRRLKRIEELPLHDRKTILKMIDAMANETTRRKAG